MTKISVFIRSNYGCLEIWSVATRDVSPHNLPSTECITANLEGAIVRSALPQHLTQPVSEEYVVGLRNPNGPAILTQSPEAYNIDIDRWIDDNVKDCDEKDREFVKSQLEKYEKERLEARREAEKQWLEQRFGRGTDDEED